MRKEDDDEQLVRCDCRCDAVATRELAVTRRPSKGFTGTRADTADTSNRRAPRAVVVTIRMAVYCLFGFWNAIGITGGE
jgi:hypothetical protein